MMPEYGWDFSMRYESSGRPHMCTHATWKQIMYQSREEVDMESLSSYSTFMNDLWVGQQMMGGCGGGTMGMLL